jgi:hypothetical protein
MDLISSAFPNLPTIQANLTVQGADFLQRFVHSGHQRGHEQRGG